MEPAVLLVRVLDLVGTFVFAISGAALGVQRGMDLFGVLVLAFVTAVFGGITLRLLGVSGAHFRHGCERRHPPALFERRRPARLRRQLAQPGPGRDRRAAGL